MLPVRAASTRSNHSRSTTAFSIFGRRRRCLPGRWRRRLPERWRKEEMNKSLRRDSRVFYCLYGETSLRLSSWSVLTRIACLLPRTFDRRNLLQNAILRILSTCPNLQSPSSFFRVVSGKFIYHSPPSWSYN
jgi:hypothetical protein